MRILVFIFTILISGFASSQQPLPIYGIWEGKDQLGNGVKLEITANTMSFYWVSSANPDLPLPEDHTVENIEYFQSIKNGSSQFIAMRPGTGYVTRLVLHSDGKLSTHNGGQRGAEAKLSRISP